MSLSSKDKAEIRELIKVELKNVLDKAPIRADAPQTKALPDFDSWKKNGIKSKLTGLIVAPEDYFEGDKKFFTWDEAIAAQEKMPNGWRLPTRQEMVLLCEEFGRGDPNKPLNPDLLMKNLKLERNGYIETPDMDEYSEDPTSFDNIQAHGMFGFFWAVAPSSSTDSWVLSFNGISVWPETSDYRTNGFSVRCVAQQ